MRGNLRVYHRQSVVNIAKIIIIITFLKMNCFTIIIYISKVYYSCWNMSLHFSTWFALFAHLKNVPGSTKWRGKKVSSRDGWLDTLCRIHSGVNRKRTLSKRLKMSVCGPPRSSRSQKVLELPEWHKKELRQPGSCCQRL
jgi:hypothetical protein